MSYEAIARRWARAMGVLFAATKADHVTPAHYANLRQLLLAGVFRSVRSE